MVLAFLILAWPVLLVVGYVCTRGLGLAILNSLLKLITVLGSSAFQKSSLNSLLKLITVLGSSAFQKALTGKKRVGRVGPWASRLPEVNTSIHLNF